MVLSIKRKIGIQGNSLRLTIPSEIAEELSFKKSDVVDIRVQDGEMVVWKKRLGE